nr:MAG TPA: hypothetical protein [Caudoviricetes sp.]
MNSSSIQNTREMRLLFSLALLFNCYLNNNL